MATLHSINFNPEDGVVVNVCVSGGVVVEADLSQTKECIANEKLYIKGYIEKLSDMIKMEVMQSILKISHLERYKSDLINKKGN